MLRIKLAFSYVFVFLALLSPVWSETQNPIADPKAIVTSGQARFTVLTPQMIRMEWSASGKWEDHASLVFLNRRMPVPEFTSSVSGGWLEIRTKNVTLRYKARSGEFTADNLKAEFQLSGKNVAWHPGLEDKGNLRGTTRTLDGVSGTTSLEPGLLSRDGWVLVDDSERPLFDNSDWPWVLQRPEGKKQDWYLFAYGHDYKQAMGDYVQIAGRIPLPPRFAFGAWWSRYWSYTDQELKELVHEFQEHDIPLDVLVVDMDWHQTFHLLWDKQPDDQSGHRLGWTGYTWNKDLFPDPPGFLSWVHQQGLKTTLNLHPASGVQPHEQQYEEMARAMGQDPAEKKYVPFDITNKKFAEAYFRILHHPLEAQGVDFWWLDWQQEATTKVEGVNPTWWLNYVHFTDKERRGQRPLLFHRWGGLGNHRYEIGFSGDTRSVWESLAFQPYFTATAANVGYGYWSHDIGGHMPGVVSTELYSRWIQFGVFSPILRTHVTKNPEADRKIWGYPPRYYEAMRRAYLLRYALLPYIYTAGRKAYDLGLSICRPLYYGWPDEAEAYDAKDEYQFGDDVIVAPVTAEMAKDSDLATRKVWLPPGTWIEWSTGARLQGRQKLERTFALEEWPVYVREGAIIPMQPKMEHTDEKAVSPLILNLFPGKGSTRVYDDAGNTPGYKSSEFTWTVVQQRDDSATARHIEIAPVESGYPGMIERRSYEIRLVDDWPAVSATVNGTPLAASAIRYDGNHATAILTTPEFSVHDKLDIVITRQPGASELIDAFPGKLARLNDAMHMVNATWPKDWSPDSLVRAAQMGDRLQLHPETAAQEMESLQRGLPKIVDEINAMGGDREAVDRALRHLKGMYEVKAEYSVSVKEK